MAAVACRTRRLVRRDARAGSVVPEVASATGKPSPPLFWMVLGALGCGRGLGIGWPWFSRLLVGDVAGSTCRSPLCTMWLGLAASAALGVGAHGGQLLPVIEFTQRTSRAAEGGAHDIYPFSVEPFRLLGDRLAQYPGNAVRGQQLLGRDDPRSGSTAQGVGAVALPGGIDLRTGLELADVTAWASLACLVHRDCRGEPAGKPGPIYQPDLGGSRAGRQLEVAGAGAVAARSWSDRPGRRSTPIRQDGYLRDGDGGFYWGLTQCLPGFRQFRFPAKLFTFTTLGMAVLAGRRVGPCSGGAGWRRVGPVLRAPGLDRGRTGGGGSGSGS